MCNEFDSPIWIGMGVIGLIISLTIILVVLFSRKMDRLQKQGGV